MPVLSLGGGKKHGDKKSNKNIYEPVACRLSATSSRGRVGGSAGLFGLCVLRNGEPAAGYGGILFSRILFGHLYVEYADGRNTWAGDLLSLFVPVRAGIVLVGGGIYLDGSLWGDVAGDAIALS